MKSRTKKIIGIIGAFFFFINIISLLVIIYDMLICESATLISFYSFIVFGVSFFISWGILLSNDEHNKTISFHSIDNIGSYDID